MVGNFYPPSKIHIDVDFLGTLPEQEIYSGIGEMLHYFFINGRESFDYISNCYLDRDKLKEIIYESLLIKKNMVEKDEFDRKERKVFNYGHTFGHAIETITDYKIPHGIAVCYGMSISNYVSYRFNYISRKEMEEMEDILKPIYSFIDLPHFDLYRYMNLLKKDKKNMDGNIGLILTKGLGHMFINQTDPNSVTDIINEKINQLFK